MGKLKVRVGDQWEDVAPDPVEEVVVAPEDPYVTDPASTAELWYDPDAVRPPSMEEEVYVGPDDPDVVAPLNTVDLWYDPDDDTTSAAGDEVWVGPDDPDLTNPTIELWYDTDAVAATDSTVMLKAHVHAHHIAGPITTGAVEWTPTLAAGDYLVQFQCSAVATVTGIRYANLDMENPVGTWTTVGHSKHWFNAVNIHYVMSNGVYALTIPTDGVYQFRMSLSASLSMDVNDFGYCTLTPATPGAVT